MARYSSSDKPRIRRLFLMMNTQRPFQIAAGVDAMAPALPDKLTPHFFEHPFKVPEPDRGDPPHGLDGEGDGVIEAPHDFGRTPGVCGRGRLVPAERGQHVGQGALFEAVLKKQGDRFVEVLLRLFVRASARRKIEGRGIGHEHVTFLEHRDGKVPFNLDMNRHVLRLG